jgi:hypothetical protein
VAGNSFLVDTVPAIHLAYDEPSICNNINFFSQSNNYYVVFINCELFIP